MPPHHGVKLNFDGTYQHALRRGSIGGVLRDPSGNVVRRFSGSVEGSNADEIEMLPMLVGCQELLNLSARSAVTEGDSFSVIQWGSRKTCDPWHLDDWLEEVQDICCQLDAPFHHIHREANDMADALAKEGVFRDSISFVI